MVQSANRAAFSGGSALKPPKAVYWLSWLGCHHQAFSSLQGEGLPCLGGCRLQPILRLTSPVQEEQDIIAPCNWTRFMWFLVCEQRDIVALGFAHQRSGFFLLS